MKKGVDYVGVTTVFFCHDGNGEFLMHKRSENCRDEYGRWDIGAGGLEFGCSVEDNIRKEIMEEYCTDVLEIEFLGHRDVHREHKNQKTHWIALDYKVRIDREKVVNGEPHKIEELNWFSFDNMPKPLHSQFDMFVKRYKCRIFRK